MTAPAKPLERIEAPKGWIEHDEHGKEITRDATCECGKPFLQFKIAYRFVEALANGRGERAANLFIRHIPDGFVPVFCPSCERMELGRLGELREMGIVAIDRQLPRGDR